MRRIFVLLVGLACLPASEASVLGPEECFSPLEQWCGDHVCPSYPESVTALERLDASAICHSVQRGTCGELRFTTQANPASGVTHYFGADGKVVGVTTFSDAHRPPPCDGGWHHYGSGPFRCTRVVEREYCRSPQSRLDPRGEIKGRIVDAATGRPLPGAVVVAAWDTELPANPGRILFGLTVGGHGGTELRTARVLEVFSADDGRFVIPSWTEAEQLRSGPLWGGSPALFAFLPGYEPVGWFESEPETFGSMSEPRNKVLRLPPSGKESLEKVRRLSQWLDAHVSQADAPDAPADSPLRLRVKALQQRASTMVQQEVMRLNAQR